MDRLRLLGVVCVVAVLASAGSFIWESRQDHQQSCDNREAIIQAFGVYTDVLVAAAAQTERTPEEQRAQDQRVEVFRKDVAKRLAPLKAGCP